MVRRRRAFVLSRRESNAILFKATDSAFSTPRGDEKVLLQKSTLFGETAYKNGRNSIKGYAHFALRLYYFDFFLRAIFVHTPVSTAARITAPIAHGTATLAAGGRYPLPC